MSPTRVRELLRGSLGGLLGRSLGGLLGRSLGGLLGHLRGVMDAPRTDPGSSDVVMLVLGAATGLATGVLAAALIGAVRVVQTLAFGSSAEPWQILLVPAIGALAVGVVVTYVAPEPSGSGVVRVMETIALHGGRFRKRVAPATVAASGVALGTGASGGREGPIVLIGGAVGSVLGRWLHADEQRIRALIAGGAAAGIGASFNAPIGGMLFAIELILGAVRARSLQVVVVAAVVGSVTARELVGPGIIYEPAVAYELGGPSQLGLYALLGLAAVPVGLAFLHGTELAARLFGRLGERGVWRPLRLALGGLATGAVALVVPQVLGTGESLPPIPGTREPVQQLLDGALDPGWGVVGMLILLALAKVVATALTVGSGNAVGIFAPTMVSGAALGAAFGAVAQLAFPGTGIQPGAFALVGTAAVFSAAARTPLTAILLVFELTGDYGLVLPLMLAAGLASFLASRITRDSIYERPLRERGIIFDRRDEVDLMQLVTVEEVMSTDHPTVPVDMPLEELRSLFQQTRSHGFAMTEGDDRLAGVVTINDLTEPPTHARTAGEIGTREPVWVHGDEPVYHALSRMAALDVGRIPVVDDDGRLAGLLRRGDVVEAYEQALERRISEEQHGHTDQVRSLTGVGVLELTVSEHAPAAGQALRDIDWPPGTLVAGVRRGGETVLPHGDAVLQPDDELAVLTAGEHGEDVRALLSPAQEQEESG